MVDTALHPRPSFYTFLQSDSNKGGDGLTYYDYQRALRSNKVAILQQKKALSYEPGYKKASSFPVSRKIFQMKNKHTSFNLPGNGSTDPPDQLKKSTSNESVSSEESNGDTTEPINIPTSSNIAVSTSPSNASMTATSIQAQTERLPRVSKKPRLVKSATARDHQIEDQKKIKQLKRPKTVSGSREIEVQTAESQLSEGNKKYGLIGPTILIDPPSRFCPQ